MNNLQQWEVNDIIENLGYTDRNSWEQCKINSYIIAQVNSRKKINKDSFMQFKWNEETVDEEEHDYEISNEEIERLKQLSKTFSNESGNT